MAELYFAYGSNMSSARLLARVDGARALGAAALHHHSLVFDKPGQDGTAKANLRPMPGAVAHGVLWEIEPQALVTLDGFEPGYERVSRPIATRDTQLGGAWTYLHPGSDLEILPSAEYVQHLLDGVREHALPAEMCRALEALLRSLDAP